MIHSTETEAPKYQYLSPGFSLRSCLHLESFILPFFCGFYCKGQFFGSHHSDLVCRAMVYWPIVVPALIWWNLPKITRNGIAKMIAIPIVKRMWFDVLGLQIAGEGGGVYRLPFFCPLLLEIREIQIDLLPLPEAFWTHSFPVSEACSVFLYVAVWLQLLMGSLGFW